MMILASMFDLLSYFHFLLAIQEFLYTIKLGTFYLHLWCIQVLSNHSFTFNIPRMI